MGDRQRNRPRARSGGQPELTTIYWRDIPAQVTARSGRERASARLGDRFQVAIDGAATRAGKTDNEAYLAEWREVRTPCGDDLEAAVEQRSNELEEEFSPELLRSYVRAGGWAP